MKKILLMLFLCLFGIKSFSQQAYNAPDMVQCGSTIFNLALQIPLILGDQDPDSYSVYFYTTAADAQAGINAIANPEAFVMSNGNRQTIYASVIENSSGLYAITNFDLVISTLTYGASNISVCGSYILPALDSSLNYYTHPNGGGTILAAGTTLTSSQTLYIYGQTAEGCNISGSFTVTVFPIPSIPVMEDVVSCSSYSIPNQASNIAYFTLPGGAETIGNIQLFPNTSITESTTVYYRSTLGQCSYERSFSITILQPNTVQGEMVVFTACETEPGNEVAFFNLNIIGDQLLQGHSGWSDFRFYEIFADAQNDINSIMNPDSYQSLMANSVVYARSVEHMCITHIIPISLRSIYCASTPMLTGHVTLDDEADGCDSSDAPLHGIVVGYNIGNTVQYTYTDVNGSYSFYDIPEGNGYLWIQNINGQNFLATPTSLPIAYNGTPLQNDFCLTAPDPVHDIMVMISPYGIPRPGFTIGYYVSAFNTGNQVSESGTITLTFDEQLLTPLYTAGGVVNGNTITWTYSNLLPQTSAGELVWFTAATPPTVVSGTEISLSAVVASLETDSDTNNNSYHLVQNAVNSYDPNDISVKEGETITPEQVSDYLHYTIRYQNSGTANAERVRILLPIDSNLNLNTFQPIAYSHDFRVVRNSGSVEFILDNINLPYESDDAIASQGFITFRIKPLYTLSVGDSMSESASIYFDFNTPINTNIVTTTVQDVAAVVNIKESSFTMLPNPASNALRIITEKPDGNSVITITDVLGKVLIKQTLTQDGFVNISTLSAGVYMVNITQGTVNSTQKLLVK